MSKLFDHVEVDSSNEEWRDIPGWEGSYQVSNQGRVKSVRRTLTRSNNVVVHLSEKLINAHISGSPYLTVGLYKDNKEHTYSIHKLVALAFVPNPEGLPEIDHIDNNPRNNCADNLRWVTSRENTAHRISSRSSTKARKVYCIDTGEIFSSISAAGRYVKASAQQVIDSINSKSCCKGLVFVYCDNKPEDEISYAKQAHAKYEDFHLKPKMPTSKKVLVVETGRIFESMTAASYYFKCDIATIRDRIVEGRESNGLTLKFVDEA